MAVAMVEWRKASVRNESERRRHGPGRCFCDRVWVASGVQRLDSWMASLVGELLQRWGAFEAQAWRRDLQAAQSRTVMMRGERCESTRQKPGPYRNGYVPGPQRHRDARLCSRRTPFCAAACWALGHSPLRRSCTDLHDIYS